MKRCYNFKYTYLQAPHHSRFFAQTMYRPKLLAKELLLSPFYTTATNCSQWLQKSL